MGLFSCKFAAKEIKKTIKVRNAAREVCNCKFVGVVTDYDQGNAIITLTIKQNESSDKLAVADSILLNVKDKFPKICNYGEVIVLFEGDDFDEKYTYYGCDMSPDIDTVFYQYVSDGYMDSMKMESLESEFDTEINP